MMNLSPSRTESITEIEHRLRDLRAPEQVIEKHIENLRRLRKPRRVRLWFNRKTRRWKRDDCPHK
jgi:hypothetical protein